MSVKTYDPANVSIVFAGVPVSGFADGTFLSVEFDEDAFNLTVGADGEGARAKTNNRSATIEFTLLQSALANDLLSAVAALDELSSDGVGPLLIKDNFGRTLFGAESAWIQKKPRAEFAKEISERVWVVRTEKLDVAFIGGNA